jgi:hypothetical protein
MVDYSTLRGRLLSEKAAVDTYINMRPRPYASYEGAACPQSNFLRVDTLKKLAWTAYEFNRGSGPRVESFVLRTNVDLKNRSFKTVDQKNLKYSSGSYLRPKASPICFSDTLFS